LCLTLKTKWQRIRREEEKGQERKKKWGEKESKKGGKKWEAAGARIPREI
jgi:hypothetical protein